MSVMSIWKLNCKMQVCRARIGPILIIALRVEYEIYIIQSSCNNRILVKETSLQNLKAMTAMHFIFKQLYISSTTLFFKVQCADCWWFPLRGKRTTSIKKPNLLSKGCERVFFKVLDSIFCSQYTHTQRLVQIMDVNTFKMKVI